MAKLARGTDITITSDIKVADDALRAVQALFLANPNWSENIARANGHADLFTARDRAWRKATGSKNTLVHCLCGKVNPHITADLATVCCGTQTLTVC